MNSTSFSLRLFFSLLFFCNTVTLFSQPYIYYSRMEKVSRDQYEDSTFRFDLNTRSCVNVGSLPNFYTEFKWDRYQRFLFYYFGKGNFALQNLYDTSKFLEQGEDYFYVDHFEYAPLHNKLYLFIIENTDWNTDGNLINSLGIADPATMTEVSRVYVDMDTSVEAVNVAFAFISTDENTAFIPVVNLGSGKYYKIGAFSITQGCYVSEKLFSEIIPPRDEVIDIKPGIKGVALITSQKDDTSPVNYTVYDFDNNRMLGSFSSPIEKPAYLFGDNQEYLALLDVVEISEDENSYRLAPTGTGTIYRISDGRAVKRINVPPDLNAHYFGTHPKNLYFLKDVSTHPEVFHVSVDSVMSRNSVTAISPSAAVSGSGSGCTIDVFGVNFRPGSTVLWNGTPKVTTFISDSLLLAELNADDIAVAGIYPITVHGSDSTAHPVDTLFFTVTDTLPFPIRLEVQKVVQNGSTADVYFGYTNFNDNDVFIPVGLNNRFLPGDENRGQITLFKPGRHPYACKINSSAGTLSWKLLDREAVVTVGCQAK